jgi:muramoyltetrapeptide carboxypeptidase LdcA involved in peptidoglycan recycling
MLQPSNLKKGDKVAILSPSFAAPGAWPHVYELGLKRLKDIFGLEPVEFSTTKKIGASKEERSRVVVINADGDDLGTVTNSRADFKIRFSPN